MPLANKFARRMRPRRSLAARMPGHPDDLRGPARGVILLPRRLSWPGMRECDVSDDVTRRAVYAMLLAQGTREEIVRLVNGALLIEDWPLIMAAVEPRVRRRWERVFEPAADVLGGRAPAPDVDPVALA